VSFVADVSVDEVFDEVQELLCTRFHGIGDG